MNRQVSSSDISRRRTGRASRPARTATTLAAISTYTPAPRRFAPGDSEPGDLWQARHGDTIYGNYRFFHPSRADHWEGPGGSRHTWDELTTQAGGDLVEIPRECIRIPNPDDHDTDTVQPNG